MKALVTGGTGFIGRRVVETLLERGDAVRIVTRDPSRVPNTFAGLVETCSWDDLDLNGIDAVVHLAGENLMARRWNEEFKQRIRQSRVETTQRLVAAIERAERRPGVLISASAIHIYGPRGEVEITEESELGQDFLGEVGQAWENAAREAEQHGVRCVQLRIGVVLGEDGGALARMKGPFKAYVGGPVGGGKQWMSWVHVRDVARLVAFAAGEPAAQGPINAVAPQPVRMKEFCKTLGKVLGRPSWLPVPGFAIGVLYGEAKELVLASVKVLPKRAEELGFRFEFRELEPALEECIAEVVVP